MKRVRFLKSHLMYQAGETAGFAEADADALIAAGKAVNADAAMVEAQEPAADTEAAEVQAEAVSEAASIAVHAEAAPPAKKRG